MTDKFMLFEFSPGDGLDEIKVEYRDKLFSVMTDYLDSAGAITKFKNYFKRAVNDAFTFAFIAGWADEGAGSPIGDKEIAWINDHVNSETQFADMLFQQLKTLRADTETSIDDKLASIEAHADGYTLALDGVYAQGALMAQPNISLTFAGSDGSVQSVCQSNNGTCVQLMGQTHPAQWWIDNDYVPRRGNRNYACGCWNCHHYLIDTNGKVWAKAN